MTAMTISSRLKYGLNRTDITMPNEVKSIPYETENYFVKRNLENGDFYIYRTGDVYSVKVLHIINTPAYNSQSLLDLAKHCCDAHQRGM